MNRENYQYTQEKVVKPPSVPQTHRETSNDYIFNSIGFYQNLQGQLDEQRSVLLSIFYRLQTQEE